MSENTAAQSATAVVNKAAQKAGVAAAAISEALPTVVETSEIAMEIPTKVVLNQRLVVIVAGAAGIGLGVAGFYGYNRLRAHLESKRLEKALQNAEANDNAEKTDNL